MNDTQAPPLIAKKPADDVQRTAYRVVGWITAIAILAMVAMLQATPTWPAAATAFAIAIMVVIVCGCVLKKS